MADGITIRAYANCDHTYVVWQAPAPIPQCRGFALFRREGDGQPRALDTWVGFEGDEAPPGTFKPSTTWPVQKFMWADYMARPGHTYRYRVVPVVGPARDQLQPADAQGSDWSAPASVSDPAGTAVAAFFNRGVVAAQWLSRRLGAASPGEEQKALADVIADPADPTRRFLAGAIRTALIGQLEEVAGSGGSVFAALFELNDPELIPLLTKLGPRASVVLANGATQHAGEDENQDARGTLRTAGVQVFDRMLSSGHLGHNKFLVVCDAAGVPARAWTGSTNWTETGLCTQANNAVLIDDAATAAAYKAKWDRLRDAGSGFPAALLDADDTPEHLAPGGAATTVWFTPTRGVVDLTDAAGRIEQAKQGIVFLMFNPGPAGTLLNAIVERASPASPGFDPDLYIHGVLNQDPSTQQHPIIGLFHRGQFQKANFDVVLPEAIDERLAFWIPEIKKLQNAWAIVHSKVVVIDPFGEHPCVMTGSHNMGPKASGKNDENLLVIDDDHRVAQAYAVNVMGIYNQYRWRFYRMQRGGADAPWTGLQDSDAWQGTYFKGAGVRELQFWMGQS